MSKSLGTRVDELFESFRGKITLDHYLENAHERMQKAKDAFIDTLTVEERAFWSSNFLRMVERGLIDGVRLDMDANFMKDIN